VINMHLREAREGGGASATYGIYDTEVARPARRKAATRSTGPPSGGGLAGPAARRHRFLTVSGEYRFRNPTSRGDLDPRLTIRR